MLHGGAKHRQWLHVQGAVEDTRIVADHALETKRGGQLVWKAEYKIGYSIAGREYEVWADSGIRGENEDEVRLLVSKSRPDCSVQYDPKNPVVSVADCR
jgi:hypothetical protein